MDQQRLANAKVIYDDEEMENGIVNATRLPPRSPSPPPPKPFFNCMNILTIGIVLAVVFGAIFGTLASTGAFEGTKGSKSVQDSQSPNNEIPVVAPVSPPVKPPVSVGNDDGICTFQDGDGFDVKGDGTLFVKQYIDTSKQTVTVEMTYNGIGWVGMAFSESPAMVPNTAIIGLPDDNIVLKYSLSAKSLAGVIPLDSSKQTLTDTSISQADGRTVLTYTKKLNEADEVSVIVGENRFNWAYGSSNELAVHDSRGSVTLIFDECAGKPFPDLTTAPTAATPPVEGGETYPPTYYPSAYPSYTPTYSPIYVAPVYAAPTYKPIAAPTYYPVAAPTYKPVVPPTDHPVAPPTNHPVVPPTHAPIAAERKWVGTWSKRGNRRSCTKDTCPTKDASWSNTNVDLGYGCTCTDKGLNSCYWDGNATTIEWYTSATLTPVDSYGDYTTKVWKLEYTGKELNLGEGSDYASGQPCYDDPLRGGFRVDLMGTGLKFYDTRSTVTVNGYSPSMKMITNNNVVVDEWTSYNTADASYTMTIPSDSTWIEVACGGWPGTCTSELYVTLA